MRKPLACLLFAGLVGCKDAHPAKRANVDSAQHNETSPQPPVTRVDRTGGQYRVQNPEDDPAIARQQAIEQARATRLHSCGGFVRIAPE